MHQGLALRPRDECAYDVVALGEVMLRLDPGEGRIRTTRHFTAWEGGGEYNVARGLRKCFGQRAAVVTALADNEVGHLVEDLICQGGVDSSWIRWRPHDGIGHSVRNGLNFTERGLGVRGAVGVSDRGHTAASQLRPGDVDWDDLFGRRGVRWFHTGGIFAALGAGTADLVAEAAEAARRHGTVVSYDLNFRPSLWRAHGGEERAREVNGRIVELVDVLIGNEEDFTAALGFAVDGVDADLQTLPVPRFAAMIQEVVGVYPSLRMVATTLRGVRSASRNDWGAIAWSAGEVHQATQRDDLDVLDRVGGGDSFASGLIYGLLQGYEPATALEYGAAHGALAMTTPGDTSMASLAEVEHLIEGGGARIVR
jgi:2-dehydro-3-deoxygluconokinase